MTAKCVLKWLDLISRDRRYGVSRERKRLRKVVTEETGESSCRFESRVTKLLEPSGEHCPELGGTLLGHRDLSISRIKKFQKRKKFREGCKSLVEVEGEMFLFNVPEVGQELICRVEGIWFNSEGNFCLVCSPAAMAVGVRVEGEVDLTEFKDGPQNPGFEVSCRVNHVADECVSGSFVKIHTKIPFCSCCSCDPYLSDPAKLVMWQLIPPDEEVEEVREILMNSSSFQFHGSNFFKVQRDECDNPGCGKKSRHRCSRCLAASFCSNTCLLQSWPQHQKFCNLVTSIRKNSLSEVD